MQNVVFTNRRLLPLASGVQVRAVCLNELTGLLYMLDASNTVWVVQTNAGALHVVRSFRAEELSKDKIVSMSYLVERQALCLVTSDGCIVKVEETGSCEEMASNEEGIQCASWSPSQQHLVLTTKNHSLIELNSEFDLVSEMPLDDAGNDGKATNCSMSWKADGKYFAVNYQVGDGRKCLTRDVALSVFKSPSKGDTDEKGLVQSVGDAPVKMGQLCAWQPVGGLIAGYDRKGPKDSLRVIFWQKNGLRHLEFPLPSFASAVNQLTWSIDSEVLYVQVQTLTKRRKLLVYHRANYHWYLKTLLDFAAGDLYLVHKQRRNKLLVVSATQVEELELSLEFSPNQWTSLEKEQKQKRSLHFSVDGDVLHITDFSRGIIPPPMSHLQVKLQEPINAAAIRQAEILLITDSTIQIYDYLQKKITLNQPNKLDTNRYWNLNLLTTTPKLAFSIGKDVYTNGERTGDISTLPQSKPIQIGEVSIVAELQHTRLTVNGKVLSDECTSFCLYDRFLLFTCNSTGMYQKLFVFNLELSRWLWECQDLPKQLPADDSKSLSLRMIERGSRIVCCSDGRVVFQLPRGNLETIYPKIVSLYRVKDCIDHREYLKALQLARTHKLDLNLLFDLNPQQFVEQCEHALKSIQKIDYINLLIASLKEQISDEVKYCLTPREVDSIKEHLATVDSKVKLVCETASAALRSIDKERYILSIYTCEVKRGDLAGVLREIKQSKQHDKVQQKLAPHLQAQKPKQSINSREVLEYVCWLADPQVIYKVALLTYDLDLVAMAAEFTQKDPKEYVPYLEELRAITDELDRRTRICLDLKKYDQAIQELARGSEQQVKRALQMVKEHHLFNKGVVVFRDNPRHLVEVKRLMANYLLSKEEINEAITILESSSLLEQALEVSTSHFRVKKMLQLMDTLSISKAQQKRRVEEILPKMIESGGEAKQLSRAYQAVGEYELAVKTCIKQGYFHRASTLLKYLKPSFQAELRQACKLAFSLQHNDILKTRRSFQEKYARLLAVQKEKREAPTLQIATKEADEMYSEYSSSHVSQSNYTVSTTTGMKKKRQKVKGILNRNVKEGSPLEEDYLVALLNDISDKFQGTLKQTKQLIQFLIHANLIEEAQQLRNEARQASTTLTRRIRPLKQVRYEQQHEEVLAIYPPYQPKTVDSITSFDWLL